MPALDVYLNETLVGELRQEGGELAFRYAPGYLRLPAPLPLSRQLPLGSEEFADAATRAFFANLLPEGGMREQVARALGLSSGNVFGLLEALGGDCAGAVTVVPPGELPQRQSFYQRLTPAELAARLAELPAHPLLAGEEGVRLSLAGAQNKLPVYFDGSDFHLPQGGAPSSHILKTAIPHLEETVLNEAFCMNLAARVGLNVPEATVIRSGDARVYMVARYDRQRAESGDLLRLHQEDFCQALGIPPELKYEKEGGPGFAVCFDLVREWSSEPLADAAALLRWALFNFLIGNADAHGKNLAFLYADGDVRLAPFYDLLSTAVYERRVDNKFAMKMGGQKDPRYLSGHHLEKFAAEIRVGLRVVKTQLRELSERVQAEVSPLAEQSRRGYGSPVIINWLERVLSQRIAKAKTIIS
ncbi:type II toxin-antitoxin system HipA family toxin [Geoalkalibacter sp.]|uniref:type II toxin-antitoxin system HipA family toxin n=1 Tax=Geoalkalibacter sp. TaxID=3041440 RepID=UPI00272E38CF|nr:type II toxin-antitoxin system HipA family toxin [Geoalkalibacter sp.]